MTKAEQIKYFTDLLRRCNRKKASPGNGFLKMRIKERLAELEKETA